MPWVGIRVRVSEPVHSLILCGTGSACLSCSAFVGDDCDHFRAWCACAYAIEHLYSGDVGSDCSTVTLSVCCLVLTRRGQSRVCFALTSVDRTFLKVVSRSED